MEKVLSYNTEKYNFKKYFENFFECDLEYIHEMYGSKDFEWDGHEVPQDKDIGNVVELIFEDMRNNIEFQSMWKSFIKDIVQDQYFKEPMLHQRLPSFKIIPAGASCKYSDICIQNGIEYSAHRDCDHPYHHPSWEVNFWMPLTKIEKSNAMILEGDDGIFYPKVINHGEVQVFFGNNKLHGPPVKNNLDITRFTIDFRCLYASQYDTNKLTDVKIKSRGKWWPQNEYFTKDVYYVELRNNI